MAMTRRRVLQTGLAAASFLAWPRPGWSQTAASPLLGLPHFRRLELARFREA